MQDKTRKEVEAYAKSFRWTPKDYYWKHTLQVRDFALMIQEHVGGDRDVVELAALLHDTGKAQLLAPGHEVFSINLAKGFLKKLKIDKKKIDKTLRCISYENNNLLESRVLRSADSMSLIMDTSGGREWFFNNIFKNDKSKILGELRKSYSEVDFDFAKDIIKGSYNNLLKKYSI
jgi:putative nucleotidyltransferase with HDIG domain